MTYYNTRRRMMGFASVAAMIGSLLTFTHGQASTSLPPGGGNAIPQDDTAPFVGGHFWGALALEPKDAWSHLRANFQWQDQPHNERVKHWITHYQANPQNVAKISERARPWLAWITEQVEERGLPGEIALVPFIESSFDPRARSHRGAAGLWQFMPGTADALGLRRNGAYDGRLDVVTSTRAALDYIELQADQWYDGNIQLSLAAYNAGAGTVNRARNISLSRGEAGDYWSLQLPNETMHYLPKLKAIAAIIDAPDDYQVTLPEIDANPGFASIPLTRPLGLAEAARLTGVSLDTMADLNPGLIGGNAHPNHTRVLLVPNGRKERLLSQLENRRSPPSNTASEGSYVVQNGDSLSLIASRQGVSVEELRRHNGLDSNLIQSGQVLDIPQRSLASR
ncbi:transglycosylase SLT domain-containing protein [Halomonas sp. TRM85114]|uniref:transglycosylase SLT domain-containing protein n=1 Tax=Halomonas jincaotanensis TaxID=2810616 RepID=UPI001BD624A6|nr:transglycosylase SLT domain-containing protein [Halomonas jincaotanensis]MBS9402516.1 transglycosylase SLT domain-containing protein [Halomonas jincaotanensis]